LNMKVVQYGRSKTRSLIIDSKIWIVLIAASIVVCYSNIYKNEFLFDDLPVITENGSIRAFPNLRRIFLTPSYTSQSSADSFKSYRPITTLSFAANYAAGGLTLPGFHAVDVLIHVANALLVYGIILSLFKRRLFAGLVAMLFAVHPVQTESVTGLFGRADELAALFVLLAFWSYIKAWQSSMGRRLSFLCLTTLMLLIGLGSKESAACLLPILIVYEICFNYTPGKKLSGVGKGDLLPKVGVIIGLLAIILLYTLCWRPSVTGQFGDLVMGEGMRPQGLLHNWPVLWRVTAFKAFAIYIKLLFWPVVLSGDYLYNQIPLTNQVTDPLVLTGIILFVGFLLLAVVALILGRVEVAFGILFFYAAYAPGSNFIIPIGALVGERLLYLPALGFCIGVGYIFEWLYTYLGRKIPSARAVAIVTAAFAILIFAYGSRAFARNYDWRNPYVFFKKTSQTSPNSAVSHYSSAVAYLRMIEDTRYIERWMNPEENQNIKAGKDRGKAFLISNGFKSLSRALEITKDHPNTKYLNVYGALLAMDGNLEQSRDVLIKVTKRDPDLLEAKVTLGAVYLRLASKGGGKGAHSSAIAKDYLRDSVRYLREVEKQKAVFEETPARMAEVYFNLSIAREKLGNYDQALEDIDNAFVWLNKSMAKTGEGQFLFGRFYMIRAGILTGKRDYNGAIEALNKARQAGFPQFQRYVLRMRQLRPLRKHPEFGKLIGQESR